LAVFERKILRRIFGTVKINNHQRSRNNNELMQIYDDLDVESFIRISRLNG
jgi:hypothetical protein